MSSQTKNWVSNPSETHGPLISVSCWTVVGVSAAFLGLRLYIRYDMSKLWMDDVLLGLSWLFLLAQIILMQLTINLGFGKHILDVNFSNLETIAYYGATGLTLSTIAINLSKISFGVTLLRLTKSWTKIYLWFVIATLTVFAIPVAVLPWVQCKPFMKTFVDFLPGTCIDKGPSVHFGEFQAGWAALMDISLAFIPWTVLWNVQIRLPEKIGIGISMSLGILAGATAIMRAVYVQQLTERDISYDATDSVIWSAAESGMTIVAVSIPILRVFVHKKVESAIEYIHTSSRRGGTSAAQSKSGSQVLADSTKLSNSMSKKESSRGGSRSGHLMRGSKQWISLDEISDTVDSTSQKSITHDMQRSQDGEKHQIPHSALQ